MSDNTIDDLMNNVHIVHNNVSFFVTYFGNVIKKLENEGVYQMVFDLSANPENGKLLAEENINLHAYFDRNKNAFLLNEKKKFSEDAYKNISSTFQILSNYYIGLDSPLKKMWSSLSRILIL